MLSEVPKPSPTKLLVDFDAVAQMMAMNKPMTKPNDTIHPSIYRATPGAIQDAGELR
jgi:hypothetical protein